MIRPYVDPNERQVIPTSIVEVTTGSIRLATIVAVGDVGFKSSNYTYEAGREYWWIPDSLIDVHGLLGQAGDIETELIVREKIDEEPPSSFISTLENDVEANATRQFCDHSVLQQSDWTLGYPSLSSSSTAHYLFQAPNNTSAKYVRLALITKQVAPDAIHGAIWFAHTDVDVAYGLESPLSLTKMTPGKDGEYPGTEPYYHIAPAC